MIFKSRELAEYIQGKKGTKKDPFVILPRPDISELKNSGAASIDLRLGRWFLSLRRTRLHKLDPLNPSDEIMNELHLTKRHFVPFGKSFVLHPRNFILGATLEWVRLPKNFAGYITGKSSWARHGLIIETAAGIHPGFTGCLTLEITNVGEVPVVLRPGMPICQVFFHQTTDDDTIDPSGFIGMRRPTLGNIRRDAILNNLSKQE